MGKRQLLYWGDPSFLKISMWKSFSATSIIVLTTSRRFLPEIEKIDYYLCKLKSRTEILVPLAAIQAVPIIPLRLVPIQRYRHAAVQLLFEMHYCASQGTFVPLVGIFIVSVFIKKDYAKYPSPFTFSLGMSINTGWGTKWRVVKGEIAPFTIWITDKHRGFREKDEGWRVFCIFDFRKLKTTQTREVIQLRASYT